MNTSPEAEDNLEFDFNGEVRPSARVAAAIREQVKSDLAPVRRSSRRSRVIVSAGAVLALVASFVLLRSDDGVHVVTRNALLGTLGWAVVVVGILLAGFGQFRATARWVQIGIALLVPVLFLVYLATLHTSWLPFGIFVTNPNDARGAFTCGVLATMLGMVSSAAVLFVWRRTDPFNPSWSGALAGLVGGLAGAMSVGLVCPGREGWHLWLGHGLSVLALSLVGAWLGRRMLAP